MSWQVVTARDEAALQAVVNQAARAFQYCTDGFSAYAALNYRGGVHLVAPGKSQTYAVEAGFAEFRRYLARLARRTLFFSRCLEAQRRAVALFVQCWNRRRLFKQAHPRYPRDYVDLDTPSEDYLRSRGVELFILDDPTCIRMMEEFIANRPELWNEDIGE